MKIEVKYIPVEYKVAYWWYKANKQGIAESGEWVEVK